MKKYIIAALVIIGSAAALAVPAAAVSESFRSGNKVVVESDKTLERTLFAGGNTVTIAGTVDGDVFCAGRTVNITGTVRGDVICAGETVNVGGNVEGDVRVAGGVVNMRGDIEGNATIAAQELNVGEEAVVTDLSVGATDVTVNGEIERDAYIGAETAVINSFVGRDVTADVNKLELNQEARIAGDLMYPRGAELMRAEGAQVAGQIERYQSAGRDIGFELTIARAIAGIVFVLLMLLTVSMALAAVFPRLFQRLSQHTMDKPGAVVLAGLAAVFVTPIAIFGLMISFIGALLGLLLLVAYLLLLFISGPVAGYTIGRWLISDRSNSPLLYMLLGSVLLVAAYFIPFIGFLVMLAAAVFGSGMVAREIYQRSQHITYDVSTMNTNQAKAKKSGKNV